MKTVWIKGFWSTKYIPGVDTFEIQDGEKDRVKLVFKMNDGQARVLPVSRWSKREWGIIPMWSKPDELHGSDERL